MNYNERLVTIIEKARKMYADDYTDHTEFLIDLGEENICPI